MCFFAACCVFCVLFFLNPFGISLLPKQQQLELSLKFAGVTLMITFLVIFVLPKSFPQLFDEKHWKVLHEIGFLLLLLLFIALGNAWLIMLYNKTGFSFKLFRVMSGYTVLIGFLPVTVSVLLKQQHLLKKYSAGAKQLDAIIHKHEIVEHSIESLTENDSPTTVASFPKIELVGDGNSEKLELTAEDLLFMTASDNYVKITYLQGNFLKEPLFRTTLKKMETCLTEHPQFYRCHKTFLVNLDKVIHISGNTQGYKLHFAETEEILPVSRSLNKEIKQKLENITA